MTATNDFREMREVVRELADAVFFPDALEIERTGCVPEKHFDLLVEHGLYGMAAPADAGGPGLADTDFAECFEILAGSCLSTMFVWGQHHGVVQGLVHTPNTALRERYLADVVAGRVRSGVAFSGAIPQPPKLWSRPVSGGYLLNGEAPFVSGWDYVELIQVIARDAESTEVDERGLAHGGDVVAALMLPEPSENLVVEPLTLVAANATKTVRLHFTDYFVPEDQLVMCTRHQDYTRGLSVASWLNGFAPLGHADRCVRLIEQAGATEIAAALRDRHRTAREHLLALQPGTTELHEARAEGIELAYHAANALVATTGSSATIAGNHGERLAREAMFIGVTGVRPETKAGVQRRLAGLDLES